MARVIPLAIVLLLAGCLDMGSGGNTVTTTSTETLYEGSVTLAPPDQEESVAVELRTRASDVTIELEGQGNVNLRAEGSGCPATDSNVMVGASGANRVTVPCGSHGPGTFGFTVRRDAGEGSVSVVVTGRVTRTSTQ